MYAISRETYADLARQICEGLSNPYYFNGEVSSDDGVAEHRLLATLIIYRRQVEPLGQEFDTITDIIPVWWECHTITDGGEVENDFDFRLFKNHFKG
ncbi:MAG: hypothetical protein IJ348_05015 [Alistipes sp.]|nr:hypothetical protein [Alistipes sp.]